MNSYTVLGKIWFWAAIALIVALHAGARLLHGHKTEKLPVIANAGIHIALFFIMLMCKADVIELFLALLISLSAALMCRSVTKKTGKGDSGKGE